MCKKRPAVWRALCLYYRAKASPRPSSLASHPLSTWVRLAVCIGVTQQQGGAVQGYWTKRTWEVVVACGGDCLNTHCCSIDPEAGLGLSCKACTGISCNSLSYTDRGEGWKMLSLPALFPCFPESGWKNECREHRGLLERKKGGRKVPRSAALQAGATFGYLLKQLLTESLAAHFICAHHLK